MAKPVALILLNWNTFQHTHTCISSLLEHADSTLFDIIVADNGSSDQSFAELKACFPTITYIDNESNLGFAEGNNRALRYCMASGYAYSLLLNTDTEVNQDIIDPLLRHLQDNPQVGAVQPAVYWMHQPTHLWNGPSYFNRYLGKVYSKNKAQQASDQQPKVVDWLTGCAMMIRNESLRSAGLFTEKFFLYYEDVDLSFRIREAGYALHYLPSTKVFHEAGASGKQKTADKEGSLSPIIHYYLIRNKLWIIRKYAVPFFIPLSILLNSFYYVALLGYFCIRGRRKKAGYVLKGIKDGLFAPKTSIWPTNNR